MADYAYLLTSALLIEKGLAEVQDITFDYTNQLLLVNKASGVIEVPLTLDTVDDLLLERYRVSNSFLGIEVGTRRDCIEFAYYTRVLAKLLEDEIALADIKAGLLRYYIHSKKYELQVDASNKMHQYDNLVAAELILEGYSLTEYMGRYFIVNAPSGKQHQTTYNNCNCAEFNRAKKCSHVQLVKVSYAHRAVLAINKLLELKD
jgi:hypothetical protein